MVQQIQKGLKAIVKVLFVSQLARLLIRGVMLAVDLLLNTAEKTKPTLLEGHENT